MEKGNGSGSKQLRALSRGLGRVQRKRREAASRLLTLGETTTSYISETEPDFDVIIKEPLLRQRKEQIDFCKSLKVFHDFPCEVFADHPSQFFFQYFRQGDVVVRCSRDTPYIVVVKTGKCKVVSDFKEKSSDRLSSAMFSTDLEHAFPLYTEMKKIEAKRPKSDTALDDKNKFKSTICAGMLTGTVDKMSLVENVQSVQSYPSHDIIKDHVHVFRDWNKYKSSLVSGIVSRNKEKQKIWVGGVPSSVSNG
ncbi:hypothetical protein KUTeg_024632 [Tegillarca granosa]|uniref:Cyclic nucleotide-binding domain-containing protein n=1 Tax=Tegillarca granosa TaxID=220873 RepID=A0ABQ9DXW4_TEGGR|nr:hypothetical protein KUTeg_024632 [Tegillarca granosa]